jgi:hypothetical protein
MDTYCEGNIRRPNAVQYLCEATPIIRLAAVPIPFSVSTLGADFAAY